MKITLCASASHYRELLDVLDKLESQGHTVLVPHVAFEMKKTGDFDVLHYKTWFADAGDYSKKQELIRKHFSKIEEGDCILVVNEEKHGMTGYIGGNVLMEMGIAFYLRKPIYLLHAPDEKLPILEEVLGMMPVVLEGDVSRLQHEMLSHSS
ncbi:MAG: hypothetical protein WCV84_01085 [Patescibacteria group bacterium]